MSFLPYVQAAGQIFGGMSGGASTPNVSSATSAGAVNVGGLNVGVQPPAVPSVYMPADQDTLTDKVVQGVATALAVGVILWALGVRRQ